MYTISLEVSMGEALDKLSILDIKCRKISDPGRLEFCKAEYETLFKVLEEHVNSFPWHYRVLTWINESIWNIQDLVRIEDINQSVRIKQYAIRIQDENDMRFRIKDKIKSVQYVITPSCTMRLRLLSRDTMKRMLAPFLGTILQ